MPYNLNLSCDLQLTLVVFAITAQVADDAAVHVAGFLGAGFLLSGWWREYLAVLEWMVVCI
jgi:hypothetical protein